MPHELAQLGAQALAQHDRRGEPLSLLDGSPCTLKDDIATASNPLPPWPEPVKPPSPMCGRTPP